MLTLVLGLAIFLGLHLVPTLPDLRDRLRAGMGPGLYKIAFSIISVISLVLIVRGYREARWSGDGGVPLWVLPATLRYLAVAMMLPAFILLAAAYIPSRIRTWARHPMLAAMLLWSAAHLLVAGNSASVVLFASFLVYAIVDRISANRRAAFGPLRTATGGIKGDIAAAAVGIAAFVVMARWLHSGWIGVPLTF